MTKHMYYVCDIRNEPRTLEYVRQSMTHIDADVAANGRYFKHLLQGNISN